MITMTFFYFGYQDDRVETTTKWDGPPEQYTTMENAYTTDSKEQTNQEITLATITANGKTYEGPEEIKEFRELYRAGKLPGIGFSQGAS